MISINVDGLRASFVSLEGKKKAVRDEALAKYKSAILGLYWQLLKITPQFSGDMVSNWDIEVGPGTGRAAFKPSLPSRSYQNKGTGSLVAEHSAGDEDSSFQSAYMRGVSRMKLVTFYGQRVAFVNASPLEIDSPLIFGTDGAQKLRDGNVISAWTAISSYLQARYGMSRTDASNL